MARHGVGTVGKSSRTTLQWQLLKTRPRALEFCVADGDLYLGPDYMAIYSPERRYPTRDGGWREESRKPLE